MNYLYADTANGVTESKIKIKAEDIVDDDFINNVVFYENEELFFENLELCSDYEIIACNFISSKTYKKINDIYHINH